MAGAELGVPMTAILKVSSYRVAYYLIMIVQGIVQHSSHIIATVLYQVHGCLFAKKSCPNALKPQERKGRPAMSKKKIGDNIFAFDSPEMNMHHVL